MTPRPMPRRGSRAPLLVLIASALTLAADAAAQEMADTLIVDQPMATRAQLEELAQALAQANGNERYRDPATLLSRVRARLENGDFEPGDRVWLEVQAESALSDTFDVGPGRELRLPPPVGASVSLAGVLRSELEPHLQEFVARFIHKPVLRARPLIRLSIQGEVVHAGIHVIPADAVLADALMAAGGTTKDADMRKLKIERNGEAIWKGKALQQAFAAGLTVDDAWLRDGDQIVVAKRRDFSIQENLRFLWVVVSLAGGIYGLSRAF